MFPFLHKIENVSNFETIVRKMHISLFPSLFYPLYLFMFPFLFSFSFNHKLWISFVPIQKFQKELLKLKKHINQLGNYNLKKLSETPQKKAKPILWPVTSYSELNGLTVS